MCPFFGTQVLKRRGRRGVREVGVWVKRGGGGEEEGRDRVLPPVLDLTESERPVVLFVYRREECSGPALNLIQYTQDMHPPVGGWPLGYKPCGESLVSTHHKVGQESFGYHPRSMGYSRVEILGKSGGDMVR